MASTAIISLATTTQELDECLELRRVVFIQEQNVAEHEERDGEDNICTHVIARLDGHTVGAARFQQIADAIKIQRVCVAKFHRGQHIGADIIRFIVGHAKTIEGVPAVKLGSQTHAIEFYRKLGFETVGEEFMDAGIPHMNMVLQLNH